MPNLEVTTAGTHHVRTRMARPAPGRKKPPVYEHDNLTSFEVLFTARRATGRERDNAFTALPPPGFSLTACGFQRAGFKACRKGPLPRRYGRQRQQAGFPRSASGNERRLCTSCVGIAESESNVPSSSPTHDPSPRAVGMQTHREFSDATPSRTARFQPGFDGGKVSGLLIGIPVCDSGSPACACGTLRKVSEVRGRRAIARTVDLFNPEFRHV